MKRGGFRGIANRSLGKIGDRVTVHGVDCEIVDDATAEAADFVVCIAAAPWLRFRDNVTGPCAHCGLQLQWRPTAPKKPPKLCHPCAMKRVTTQEGEQTT